MWFFVLGNNTSVVDNSANKSKSGSQKPDNPSKSEKAGVAARSDVKPEPPLILAVPAPMASMLDGKDLQSLPADQLLGMANAAEAKGDYARAAPLQFWYAKKSKQGYYNLACYCARLGQKDAAFYWLQIAALEEGVDTAHATRDEDLVILHRDSRWAVVQTFLTAANHYFETAGTPRTVLVLPAGYDGSTPLTVVAWLHGLGSSTDDFVGPGCQDFASELKIAFVGVSGTVPRGPRTFVWSEDPARDAKRVDDALSEISDLVKIKPGHVITMGFSQGAQMGLEIAVRNPEKFAGAIVMSPGAKSSLAQAKPSPLLAKRGFVLTCGAKEHPGNVKLTADAAKWLQGANAKVQHKPYAGMAAHAFPPDFDARFGEWVRFIEKARD